MNRFIKIILSSFAYSPLGDKLVTWGGGNKLHARLNVRSSKKKLLEEAKLEYEKGSSLGNLEDYKQALDKHWVSYSEYAHQYEFYKKTEEEREEYVSRLRMRYFYMRYGPGILRPLFRNKQKFLKVFDKYIHRKWLFVPNASYNEFVKLVTNSDCIVKPYGGSLGKGVFKVKKDISLNDIRTLYDYCVLNKNLVEEIIESCEELKAFHPQSLNTIRVVTISNRNNAEIFGSFIRMGVGDSVIDNAHAGGIFAQINIKTGKIVSDGINTDGGKFIYHPDSKLQIKGFKIPHWDIICDTCCEAAKLTDNPITGWDVVINSKGQIEFVEGNHSPDFDVMQSPLQVGVKKRIFAKIKEYRGIEMK